MSGWLPVYDTMHGIRGEVNIVVKVDLFSDFNKFRQSSCGVQFFFSKLLIIKFVVSIIRYNSRCNLRLHSAVYMYLGLISIKDQPNSYVWTLH